MALVAGTRIGPYEVVALIGVGGMGEVYRARDARLGRDVALKILPEAFTLDGARVARFRREAQVLASLNHQNVAAIYGFEDSGNTYALVLELAEGRTLADRIAKGALPLDEALPIAGQIAQALEAAHEKGVIHRDLKPANVKVRDDGTVKVLDFGLAKQTSTPGFDDVTQSLVTRVGTIVGTPAYMAPEQVQGKESDHRTDLFAFGLLLYEMVTGAPPFPGASLGRMLASGNEAAIAPPCEGRSRIASRLNALILRLLASDPAQRPQSATVVREELIKLRQVGRVRPATLAAAAGACVLVLAAALWRFYSPGVAARRWPDVSRVRAIATHAGDKTTPSVSPDGTLVAFSWTGEDGRHQDIYVIRSDGQDEPRQLTRDISTDTVDVFPAWSPDGRQIAFVRKRGAANGDIIVVPAAGGPERTLRAIRFAVFPAFSWLAWTPTGAQLAFASQSLDSGRSALFLMRLSDGTVRSLTTPPDGVIGDASPAFSSDGRSLAFVRWSSPSTSTLMVLKLGAESEALGGPTTVPMAGKAPGSPAWAGSRRLLFSEGARILEWEAGAAAEQVYLSGERLAGLSIAGRGDGGTARVVVGQQSEAGSRIWAIPLRAAGLPAGPPVLLSSFGSASNSPDYAPDGKHVVFVSRRGDTPELWMTDEDGSNLKQLTRLGVQSLGVPRWSNDNRHVAFFARKGPDEPQIYVIDATQDQPIPRQATHENPGCNIPSWSRNGKFLYCSRRIGGEMRLYRVPAESGGKGDSEMERWFEGKSAAETSDGRVLYIKDGRPGLFARSLAGDPTANLEERLVEDIRGPIGYFAPVAEGVYYTAQDSFGRYVALRFFDYARRRTIDVAPESITGQVNSLTVTPDGRRLVYTQVRRAGINLALIEFQ